MTSHYFNEIDPFAAQWLRELIVAGHIAKGDVDERSIEDIAPVDLRGRGSVHLFAGVGVWSYALRLAGWPDERPVWTCSCPCQPFSSAGKGGGFGDERHLWPAAFHLIRECRPLVCFGEQVASDDGFAWLDLVQADLESVGYTVGSVVTPAAGYGAPHGRHRIYWCAVGNTKHKRRRTRSRNVGETTHTKRRPTVVPELRCGARELGDTGHGTGCTERRVERDERDGGVGEPSGTGDVGNADCGGVRRNPGATGGAKEEVPSEGKESGLNGERAGLPGSISDATDARAVGGFWRDADWIHCAPEPGYPNGRWRPVEPGTFPLAHGAAARVGRLRGFGNAIVASQAAAWIKTFLEVESLT